MSKINENFLNLQENYLFSTIAKKVGDFTKKNPEKKIIKLGIGDVTLPLIPSCVSALHSATDDMANTDSFKGYGPEQGYSFLRDAIVKNEYIDNGIDISSDEIFVSDGSKCDCGNIVDIFGSNTVAITDPVYPVYLDTNIMCGRKIIYIPVNEQNHFKPSLPKEKVDLIYLCFPNNPTGTVLTKSELKVWVDYAKENNSIILYDSAYEAYISTPNIPKSIYEIDGARDVAIEFRSFSKTAGFTGLRCAYCVVPKTVFGYTDSDKKVSLNMLWNRRTCTKFNGVPYIVQKAAEAIYSPSGKKEVNANIGYYMENARIIKNGLDKLGYTTYGGVDSPYVWLKTPSDMTSWDFFDMLLTKASVVGTPGSGFGKNGEGYFRLTSFGSRENTIEAIKRFELL